MMYGSPPQRDLNRPFPPYLKEETDLNRQMSSGLLRYRSAPRSLFGELCEDFLPAALPAARGGDVAETLFARFLAPDLRGKPPPLPPPGAPLAVAEENADAIPAFSSASSQMLYQQHLASSDLVAPIEIGADHIKNGSNLIRQSSSPAGFFTNLNTENGYAVMRGGTRLKSQLSFSSRQSSMMSQISEENENENESMEGYSIPFWEESAMMPENYFSGGIKKGRVNGIQNGESRNGLAHQFSLPKTSSEMAAFEKFLQFQDSVPCKIRAKRGCATHPRSIAERVRRTRISERMRKLQELVPNMDKQTNTADMLDLAVDYIKELQKQVKTISSSRAKCTCSSTKRKS